MRTPRVVDIFLLSLIAGTQDDIQEDRQCIDGKRFKFSISKRARSLTFLHFKCKQGQNKAYHDPKSYFSMNKSLYFNLIYLNAAF
jgi:hypothetical protein